MLIAYDGADGLDLFGPAEVFSSAGQRLGEPAYDIGIAAAGGGLLTLNSGVSVATRDLATIRPRAGDTILVAGSSEPGAGGRGPEQRPACLVGPRRAHRSSHRLGV